ncbi:MAG TPA: DUF2809 domain-containing protein [Gemmatimonadaceae bacterium]|nr:DUF2809 domain-containing protein [Gemmatimonadaceae bacterium]
MTQASYPPVPSLRRARLAFVALAVGTIAVGLMVHRHGTLLSATLRDVLGDALWAMMICWWIGAVVPNTRVASRAGLGLAICWIVEVSQLYHTPLLDAWRRTTPGQLILGSGFDVRDLGAYALGIVAALLLELSVRRRNYCNL